MTSPGIVAKYLSEGRDTVSRERSLRVATLMGGLRSLGFPLEVGIGNDAHTFDTAPAACELIGILCVFNVSLADQCPALIASCAGVATFHADRERLLAAAAGTCGA